MDHPCGLLGSVWENSKGLRWGANANFKGVPETVVSVPESRGRPTPRRRGTRDIRHPLYESVQADTVLWRCGADVVFSNVNYS